jgi:hypothetical protein
MGDELVLGVEPSHTWEDRIVVEARHLVMGDLPARDLEEIQTSDGVQVEDRRVVLMVPGVLMVLRVLVFC